MVPGLMKIHRARAMGLLAARWGVNTGCGERYGDWARGGIRQRGKGHRGAGECSKIGEIGLQAPSNRPVGLGNGLQWSGEPRATQVEPRHGKLGKTLNPGTPVRCPQDRG